MLLWTIPVFGNPFKTGAIRIVQPYMRCHLHETRIAQVLSKGNLLFELQY
jgi:hypothetical protein